MVRPLTSRPSAAARRAAPSAPRAGAVSALARRPGAHAEGELLGALLSGRWAPGEALPPERELAGLLGVTRPTLREALKKLSRDGFVTVRHGVPTRANDVWTEGGLSVLAALAAHGEIPRGFVTHLLEVRETLAPAWAREAVKRAPARVAAHLAGADALGDDPAAWTAFDGALLRLLAVASGNPVHVLILNGFRELYARMAPIYFGRRAAREASRAFYAALREAAAAGDAPRAESVTRDVMARSVALWKPLESRLAAGRAR